MFERKLTILYGSQTGTAQDLAEDIWRESKCNFFKGTIKSMDSYDVQNLIKEKIVLFICSTTGQGDEPDNMKQFWKFLLRKNLPSDSLSGIRFGVLGLGDSSYTKFNFVAKRLNKRLQQLGGIPLVSIGLCDDQHDLGVSAVSIPWIKEIWEKLDNLYPLPEGANVKEINSSPYRWNVSIIDDEKENNENMAKAINEIIFIDSVYDKPFETIVEENIRTTAKNHFQDVRLLSLRSGDALWNPGDIVVCRPKNSKENVQKLFDLFNEHNLNLYPETVIMLEELDEGEFFFLFT